LGLISVGIKVPEHQSGLDLFNRCSFAHKYVEKDIDLILD
jgi:hypothetical protein